MAGQTIIADQVRAELARKRLSQEDLADRLGISRQAVGQRLSGAVDFRATELLEVASFLSVPVESFFAQKLAPVVAAPEADSGGVSSSPAGVPDPAGRGSVV